MDITEHFTIEKVTHNAVTVKWIVSGYLTNKIKASNAFALTGAMYPTAFFLLIDLASRMSLKLHSSSAGRAVIKLELKHKHHFQKEMIFMNGSHFPVEFLDTRTFPEHCYLSDIHITCYIKWLGGLNDAKKISGNIGKPQLTLPMSLNNEKNPDFHIIIDNKKFPAHKVILAGHSPILAAILDTPITEGLKNQITIEDIDYSTMKILLKVMYTGITEDLDDTDTALKVLRAAEKYQMISIKNACENKLQMGIQDNNVLTLLDEADSNNAVELCYTCVEYIIANNCAVIPQAKLKEFSNERLNVKNAIVDIFFNLTDRYFDVRK